MRLFTPMIQPTSDPLSSAPACRASTCGEPVLPPMLPAWPTTCGNRSGHNNTSAGQQLVTLTMACSMLVLCVVGLYGNVVCALIFSRRSMRSSINVLLMGLSGLDSAILLLSIPSFIVPALDDHTPVPYWGCLYPLVIRIVYPLVMTAQTASVWTFVVISLERYIAVCRPFDAVNIMSRRKAACAQILVIFSSFLYNGIRFWEYKTEKSPPWYSPLLRDNEFYFGIYYTGFYWAFNFLLPFAIISVLNVKIASTVRHVGSRQKNTVIRSTTSTRRREYRTTRLIFVVTLLFAVCNTPAYVVNIWEALDKRTFESSRFMALLLSDAVTCLILINSATTLLIYLVFCRRFRRLFLICHSCGHWTWQGDRSKAPYGNIRNISSMPQNFSACSTEMLRVKMNLINADQAVVQKISNQSSPFHRYN